MADKGLEGWDVYQAAGGWGAKKFLENRWKEVHVTSKVSLAAVCAEADEEVERRLGKIKADALAEADALIEAAKALRDEHDPKSK